MGRGTLLRFFLVQTWFPLPVAIFGCGLQLGPRPKDDWTQRLTTNTNVEVNGTSVFGCSRSSVFHKNVIISILIGLFYFRMRKCFSHYQTYNKQLECCGSLRGRNTPAVFFSYQLTRAGRGSGEGPGFSWIRAGMQARIPLLLFRWLMNRKLPMKHITVTSAPYWRCSPPCDDKTRTPGSQARI